MSIYTVSFTGVAVTAQQDFFELTAPSAKILAIHGVELSQSTEVGDAQEEGLSILFRRGTSGTTSGSGGSAPTPAPVQPGDTATFTAEVNNTTKMSGGTVTTIVATNWNVRATPMAWSFMPELRPIIGPSQRFTVELATVPADSITVSGTVWVEEIG